MRPQSAQPLLVGEILISLALAGCGGEAGVVVDAAPVPDVPGSDVPEPPPDCTIPIACPGASNGHFSACGRVFDLETTVALDDGVAATGEPSQHVGVTLFDAIAYAMNPDGTPPIASAVPDSCGRFAFADQPLPAFGGAAIVIGEREPVTGDRVRTAITRSVGSGQVLPGVAAWTLRRATDVLWSTSAGLPAGTFSDIGFVLHVFVDARQPAVAPFAGTPVAGVVMTRDGTMQPTHDYYFTDLTATERTTISTALPMTGANGSGLLVDVPSFAQLGGTGSEPAGCAWPSTLAMTVPGIAFVAEHVAVVADDPSAICR